ncbi:MAG: hypothetical protein M3270_02030 [Thermoproteota archaeon]|nr:hypothetical protein [Thermoproteota archaeon]
MNAFEVAILRVLIKRQQPVKLSALVSGFPDDCEDGVLSAVSNLKLHGYIILNDYQPNGDVLINRERRREILRIVDPDINSDKLEVSEINKNYHNGAPVHKKSFGHVISIYATSQTARTIAISSLVIVGLIFALGSNMPTTSPDIGPMIYYQHMPYNKWAGNAYGAYEHDDVNNPSPSPLHVPPPLPATSIALKDCNQKLSQQQS